MDIKFRTNFYKVETHKGYNFFKALDTDEVEGYSFFVTDETAEAIKAYRGEIAVKGYTYKNDKGVYRNALSYVKTVDGDTLYEYKKP